MKESQEKKEWDSHKGLILDSVDGFDVIECENCFFKHIVPIPSPEELKAVYQHEYYTIEKPLYLERFQEDLEWWNLVYSDRFDTFENHLSDNKRRLLDIGSGPGYFLLYGKNRGWDTLGIEPSKLAAGHSRDLGLEIIEDFLTEETAGTLGRFDVVHLSEVLEHIPNPVSFIKIVKRLLHPDGLICFIVPNDYNPFQIALKDVYNYKPWWIAPPHHINFFNFDSLRALLTSLNFKIVLEESTFPIDIFLLMGDNYIGNDKLGRFCHGKRKIFEKNMSNAKLNYLKRDLYRSFANLGLGREVLMIGKKNG